MSNKLTNADEPNWGLFYREHRKDLNERKSIKVKLPIRQHIRLHAMKLFTENNISETVERALDQYFSDLKDEEAGAGATGVTGPVTGDAPDAVVDGVNAADVVDGAVTATGATRRNG